MSLRMRPPPWLLSPALTMALVFAAIATGSYAVAAKPNRRRQVSLEQVNTALKALEPTAVSKTPGAWMKGYPDEKNQTFAAYRVTKTTPLTWDYPTLYVQPIGDFGPEHQEIVALTRDYLGRLFGAAVKELQPLGEEAIPAAARRVHPDWGDKQILSIYVLDQVLKPKRPKDALAVLGLTATDLWPGEGWNFVFGQASLSDRVGVWSVYRYGDPAAGDDERQLCLRRTLKVAGHETGHMLGIPHCTAHECGMNGSNNREEMDSEPLAFCPQCAAKVWWATDRDPAAWHESLIEFADREHLDDEAAHWREGLKRLRAK